MDAFVDIDIAELELLMEQQGLAPEATPYGDDAMFTPELFLSRSGYDAYTNNFDALEEAWLNLQVTTDTNTSKINDKPLFNEDGFGITILDVHSNALGTAIIDNVSEFFDNPTNGLWFAHFASVIQLEYDEGIIVVGGIGWGRNGTGFWEAIGDGVDNPGQNFGFILDQLSEAAWQAILDGAEAVGERAPPGGAWAIPNYE